METQETVRTSQETESKVPARRPYEQPNLVWTYRTELVANVASACARFGGSGGGCNTNPSS